MMDTRKQSRQDTAEGGASFLRLAQAQFEQLDREPGRSRTSWLSPMREGAIARFAELGLPTTRMEAWRCTSVAPLEKVPFRLASNGRTGGENGSRKAAQAAALLERAALGIDPVVRLVFVNGRFAPRVSALGRLPSGVRLVSLGEALETDRSVIETHLGQYAAYDTQAFTALNTAFLEDGALLSIPPGARLEEPIFLLFLSTSREGPIVSHPRNLVLAGAGSQATIVESYAGMENDVYFTNAVTEIVAGDGAIVDHYKLQRESDDAFHIATLQVRLGARSVFSSHSISLGGGLVRNDVGALLDGEGADCTLNGLFIARGRQHVDNHTLIDHAKPHGTSRETYKGVLDGTSRGVFDGTIVVRADAQKTDARQTNRNLLLSDGALIDTKPQLEIRADDVKCAHAATIGRLDETSLFYLRSRGIDLEAARGLLIHAFASEIVGRVRIEPLRRRIDESVSRALLGDGWAGEAA